VKLTCTLRHAVGDQTLRRPTYRPVSDLTASRSKHGYLCRGS